MRWRAARSRLRGGFTAKELLVVTAIVASLTLILAALVASHRVQEGRLACGRNQAQIVTSMRAYAVSEECFWPSPWANLDYHYGRARDADDALRVTVRSFEVLAAVQGLPNALFACPVAPEEEPMGVPSRTAGDGPRWGDRPGSRVSYAFDWACPAEPGSARVVLADRDPQRHWRVVAACYGDTHARTLPCSGPAPSGAALRTAAHPGRAVDTVVRNTRLDPEYGPDDIYAAEDDATDDQGLREGFGHSSLTWVK